MTKFNDLENRIEFQGTRLVNANKTGHCAWCGDLTLWYDMELKQFLCSEECTVARWGEVFHQLLERK